MLTRESYCVENLLTNLLLQDKETLLLFTLFRSVHVAGEISPKRTTRAGWPLRRLAVLFYCSVSEIRAITPLVFLISCILRKLWALFVLGSRVSNEPIVYFSYFF